MEKPELIQLSQRVRMLKIQSDELTALMQLPEIDKQRIARKARMASYTAKDIAQQLEPDTTPELLGMATNLNPKYS